MTVPHPRALISVHDKSGVANFARILVELGWEIISTGGTARYLQDQGVTVTLLEQVTQFPEMLDGRVKTLHPHIHAAILANLSLPHHREQLAAHGLQPIELVAVNLYPFGDTIRQPDCRFHQAVEMIDIGGPALLRAAAKNHTHVWPVADPRRYGQIVQQLRQPATDPAAETQLRRELARDVFAHISRYDRMIASYLTESLEELPALAINEEWPPPVPMQTLRYGENPHQRGWLIAHGAGPLGHIAHDSGVEISFNNLVDGQSAYELLCSLQDGFPGLAAAVFIKHNNSCGVGVAEDPIAAYRQAYQGDPLAAMGGILAQNVVVDEALAQAVMFSLDEWGKAAGANAFFIEVWLANEFTPDARTLIRSSKAWGERVRLIPLGHPLNTGQRSHWDFRRLSGGWLIQESDLHNMPDEKWEVVTPEQPTNEQWRDLRLAYITCKHTRSNAITLVRDGMLLGNGAGQMSRVMSCRIATWQARENGHGEFLRGAVAASDAFFPFADGPQLLIEAGVQALIQPGGSKRDSDTIELCTRQQIPMILTHHRHFKH
ncbi:MAG: Bifunctional purine biosynthesis protein PurH [Phycisphaerae bacterium]|nr:Bifunctional purine biosynthesis protein PurH [Phycisphaerae bacterium]